MSVQGSLIVAAIAIVVALAVYAAILWRKVAQQQQQRSTKIAARQLHLQEQIQQIAKAALAEQCQPAEAALRLVNLLRAVPGADSERLAQQFPHLQALYDAISTQPILEQRKALPKLERRKLDMELEHHQAVLGPAISTDVAILADSSWRAQSLSK
ncbi:DUF2489 domain-containing protein [Ferrimonas lipolytica]|uniref:DUF2489 domain-containing protein n=1 Tax=Ferrimonas lipolytica TaxID=2724191 RepID=A0A6H1UHH5_9GAMM|nr:DUF2489 domain-containing protein [Ferrimonas lipolytica]QIZ78278.1 DUF2489 domain-containing protein [Ferrimonas lipolytica]